MLSLALLRIEHGQMLEHHVDQWGDEGAEDVRWEQDEDTGDYLVYKKDRPVFFIAPHLLNVLQGSLHKEKREPEPKHKPSPRSEGAMPPGSNPYKLR